MKKVVMWSLFDSGNGSYAKVAVNFPQIENFSIGIDRENKNDHFINLDLADYSYLFGKDQLFETLDKLPKPDIILASPPCESWSNASSMRDGNACWKQEKGDALFEPQQPLSRFTVRDDKDYTDTQFYPRRQIARRINGELTILNTVRVIERYEPLVYVIENPGYGRLWDYLKQVLGFVVSHENLTFYNNYDDYDIKKPTKFGSNIDFQLRSENIASKVLFNQLSRVGGAYNARSNIPPTLVNDILVKSMNYIELKRNKLHPIACEGVM